MVAADVHEHDACVIRCDGADESVASETLASYITRTLPSKDAPLPKQTVQAGELVIPRSLLAAKPEHVLRGRSVNGGIATGVAVHVRGIAPPTKIESIVTRSPAEEIAAFRKALRTVSGADRRERQTPGGRRTGRDGSASITPERSGTHQQGRSDHQRRLGEHAQAVLEAGRRFLHTLEQSTSLYLRERVLDLQDVVMQLLAALGHAQQGG